MQSFDDIVEKIVGEGSDAESEDEGEAEGDYGPLNRAEGGGENDDEGGAEPEVDNETEDEDISTLMTQSGDPTKPINAERVKKVIVADENRVTRDILTEYEMAKITSHLAVLVAKNGNSFIFLDDEEIDSDPISNAKKMINKGKCPFIIEKKAGHEYMPDGTLIEYYEHWRVNEMYKPYLF